MMCYKTNKCHASGAKDAGFVLPTALLLLTLLTMLATTMYYVSRTSMVTSNASNTSISAIYYAETAIHYMSWALANDAEFDNFSYTGSYVAAPFGEPPVPPSSGSAGDSIELMSYLWNPGPTGTSATLSAPGGPAVLDTAYTTHTAGQVLYFDNSPMGGRHLCMESAAVFSNCIDITLKKKDRAEPVMSQISTYLPRYIKLDMAAGDSASNPVIPPSIVASIPSLPHRNPPQVENDQLSDGSYDHNGDIPKNGAVVWLTAADPFNENHDLELFPLDPAGVYGGVLPNACHVNQPYNVSEANACPCLQAGGQINTGSIASNTGIHWEVGNQSGNDIVIQYNTAGVNMPLSVAVGVLPLNYPNLSAVVLTVSLATDNLGAPTSTASDVIDAANTYLTDPNVLADPNTPAEFSALVASPLKALDDPAESNGIGVVAVSSKTLVHLNSAQGCNANTGEWMPISPSYKVVAYVIGYVNGKPSHMLRAVIK